MGTKCTSDPTITAAIRDLNVASPSATDAETRFVMGKRWRGMQSSRSLVGIVVVTILLCQLSSSHCFAVVGGGGGSGSDPLIVEATIEDRDATNVLINEVEDVQRTCDR